MFGLQKFGDGIAFDRIDRFCAAEGVDRAALARISIAVTGSNGKGSTARFIASALRGLGLRTGCFTSPHLFDVRERFDIDDAMIEPAAFDRLAARVKAFADTLPPGDRMGAFEFVFLVGVLWFTESGCDAIVWEAGIGGRYDPIRATGAGVSAMTSIEREHTELLGQREDMIACDKCDALAPGGVLVLSPSINDDIARAVTAYARLSRRSVQRPPAQHDDLVNTPAGAVFTWRGEAETQVRLPLIGRHQVDNAVTAIAVASAWLVRDPSRPQPHGETLARMLAALADARWPGRLQHVAHDPDLWIDVGHTPHALDIVTETFADIAPREKTLVVFGVSAAKDVSAIADIVARRFPHVILTRAFKSGADPATFADRFATHDAVLTSDTITAAQIARARATAEGLTVLAIGGLFLAVEIAHAWNGGDPRELAFL